MHSSFVNEATVNTSEGYVDWPMHDYSVIEATVNTSEDYINWHMHGNSVTKNHCKYLRGLCLLAHAR